MCLDIEVISHLLESKIFSFQRTKSSGLLLDVCRLLFCRCRRCSIGSLNLSLLEGQNLLVLLSYEFGRLRQLLVGRYHLPHLRRDGGHSGIQGLIGNKVGRARRCCIISLENHIALNLLKSEILLFQILQFRCLCSSNLLRGRLLLRIHILGILRVNPHLVEVECLLACSSQLRIFRDDGIEFILYLSQLVSEGQIVVIGLRSVCSTVELCVHRSLCAQELEILLLEGLNLRHSLRVDSGFICGGLLLGLDNLGLRLLRGSHLLLEDLLGGREIVYNLLLRARWIDSVASGQGFLHSLNLGRELSDIGALRRKFSYGSSRLSDSPSGLIGGVGGVIEALAQRLGHIDAHSLQEVIDLPKFPEKTVGISNHRSEGRLVSTSSSLCGIRYSVDSRAYSIDIPQEFGVYLQDFTNFIHLDSIYLVY